MMVITGAQDAQGKAEGAGLAQAGEQYVGTWLEGVGNVESVWSGCTYSEVHGGRVKSDSHKLKHGKFCLKNLYHNDSDQTGAQKDCETSILGCDQDSTGNDTEKPALTSLALSSRLDRMRPFPTYLML